MPEPIAYSHRLRRPASTLRERMANASTTPYWLDHQDRPPQRAAFRGDVETDLVIVGGGYTGLWTAIQAKERRPGRRVVLLEGKRIGWAASGRNGGFCEASLTHGEENGARHLGDELAVVEQLAAENFSEFAQTLDRYGIDAEFEQSGMLTVATEPHQARELGGSDATVLTGAGLERYARSPLYRAGVFEAEGIALVHPAKLAWGLARTAEELGVQIYEGSPAIGLERTATGVAVRTAGGVVRAGAVALATNGFPSLLRRLRLFTVPIYDYVLMTEPLSDDQLASIGWVGRHGIADAGHEFHYYRKSRDNRILFGGYDAVYHRGRRIRPEQDQREETFLRLADHFASTFPSLEGMRFTHRWGGMIDMSTQLMAFHGQAAGGRIAYSAGYTGLGVCATRFGASVMLDLIEHRNTERTRLRMSRRLPVPIPPEPIAYPLIQAMRRAVAAADRNGGVEGPLLRAAGLFGIGFDS